MPRNQGTSRKGKPKKNDRAAGMGRALQKSQRPRARYSNNKQGGMDVIGGVAAPSTLTPMENADKNISTLEIDPLNDFLLQAEVTAQAVYELKGPRNRRRMAKMRGNLLRSKKLAKGYNRYANNTARERG